MSREIKFRAWDKKNKKYRELGVYDVANEKVVVRFPIETLLKGDYILEQYTGLEDKNGKEIYEGDIVNVIGIGIAQVIDSPSGEWMLYYRPESDEINSSFASVVPKNKPTGLWKTNTTSYIEVIGNIHENQELLGGEE